MIEQHDWVHAEWTSHLTIPSRGILHLGGSQPWKNYIIFIRGEGNRIGDRGQYRTVASFATFARNMRSYKVHLFEPLMAQSCYNRVFVVANIKTIPGTEALLQQILRNTFGEYFIDSPFTNNLSDIDEANSMISSYVAFRKWYIKLPCLRNFECVYFVRADVELKQKGLDTWPT